MDFRKLDSITIGDRHIMPKIAKVLSRVGNKFFSVLDLKNGFHQIRLKEDVIENTTFSVKNGKYEFTRLPFGLHNAPSIFQRILDDIYIDDIIIFSKDKQSNLKHIDENFKTLDNVKKVDFFRIFSFWRWLMQ